MKPYEHGFFRCSMQLAVIITNVIGIAVLYVVYMLTVSGLSQIFKVASIGIISIIYISLSLAFYLGARRVWRGKNQEKAYTPAEALTFVQSLFYISLGLFIGLGYLP